MKIAELQKEIAVLAYIEIFNSKKQVVPSATLFVSEAIAGRMKLPGGKSVMIL